MISNIIEKFKNRKGSFQERARRSEDKDAAIFSFQRG